MNEEVWDLNPYDGVEGRYENKDLFFKKINKIISEPRLKELLDEKIETLKKNWWSNNAEKFEKIKD